MMATQEALTPSVSKPLSLLHGASEPPLLDLTLGDVLDIQTERYGSKECLVIPWTGARWSYYDLSHQSMLLARALVASGIRSTDRVGIMAGNSEQYVAVFFACMRIGAILVILNNTYTASEAKYALQFTGEKDPVLPRDDGNTNSE